ATHARGLLDPPQRPPETAKCQDLLFLLVAQDVAHSRGGPLPSRPRQRPAPSAPLAGFQTIMLGRFWVIPEDQAAGPSQVRNATTDLLQADDYTEPQWASLKFATTSPDGPTVMDWVDDVRRGAQAVTLYVPAGTPV